MPARPIRRPAHEADVIVERRHWWSRAAAALAVTALAVGLVAASPVTGHAEPATPAPVTGAPAPLGRPTVPSATPDPAVTAPFTPTDGGEPLRAALVAERAAQRAEELARSAAAISRAAAEASKKARQDGLTAAEKATAAKAAALAQQALDRAAAARAAAVTARLEAEAAARTAATSGAPGAPSTPGVPNTPVVIGNGKGTAPVPGAVVGSTFGQRGLWASYHTGLDFRAAYNVPIRAVKAGTVIYAGNTGNWAGNHVAVLHGDGFTTMSSHMSSMAVSAGQTVQAGQVIGYVGQTGRAFGPHLHFEVYPPGVRYGNVYSAVNPVPWLQAAGVITR